MSDNLLLTFLWLLPLIGMVGVLAVPRRLEWAIKYLALAATLITFVATLIALRLYVGDGPSSAPLQDRVVQRASERWLGGPDHRR